MARSSGKQAQCRQRLASDAARSPDTEREPIGRTMESHSFAIKGVRDTVK